MYIPKDFHETSIANIRSFIECTSLACIVANTDQGLIGNHIPLFFNKEDKLIGHVAFANDIHRMIEENQKVLAIFKGVDSYISPNWYPSKSVHHEHVPTWNYQVAHVSGQIKFKHDMPSKRRAVAQLTHHFERKTNGDKAWKMGDAPADFIESELEHIVAFEIVIDQILAKSKLSQNRTHEDRENVATKLEEGGQADGSANSETLIKWGA